MTEVIFFFWSVFIYCKLYLFCIDPCHCFHKTNKIFFYMMSLFSLYACVHFSFFFFLQFIYCLFLCLFIKSLRSSNRPTGSQPPCLTSGNDIGLDTTLFYELCEVQKCSGTIQWTFYLTTEHSFVFIFCLPVDILHCHLNVACFPHMSGETEKVYMQLKYICLSGLHFVDRITSTLIH